MSTKESSGKYNSSFINRPFPLVDPVTPYVYSPDHRFYFSRMTQDEVDSVQTWDREFAQYQPELSKNLSSFICEEIDYVKGQLKSSRYNFGRRDFSRLEKLAREHAIRVYLLLCNQSAYDDLRLQQIVEDNEEPILPQEVITQTKVTALPKISTQTLQNISQLVRGVRKGKHYLDPLVDVREFIRDENSTLEEIIQYYDKDREYPVQHVLRQSVLFVLAALYVESNPYSEDKLDNFFNR